MSFRDTLHRLAGHTEAQAVAAYEAWQAGRMDDETFAAVLSALVAAANSRAVALADLSLALTITVALRRTVTPLGLLPPADDPERLHKAAQTLRGTLAATPDPAARVARLGRSEPLMTARQAYSRGMAASPHVTGYTRGLSGRACQLCRWWSREGQVWPADHPMPSHKGCSCTPIPVTQ